MSTEEPGTSGVERLRRALLREMDEEEWGRFVVGFIERLKSGYERHLKTKQEEATWDRLRTKWASKHRTRVVTIEWKITF